ncbi:MAG: hypothetical protein P9M15_05000 [Candidatus Electryoneaceae bacterium]|nr:hypothetical protein [Candidatus Electryoneaceae bacterium]
MTTYREEAFQQTTERVKACRRNMVTQSQAVPILEKIEELLEQGDYAAVLEASGEFR